MKTLNLKFIFSLLISFLLISSQTSATEVTEEWVKRYDSPVMGDDYAVGLGADAAGNVYVTGHIAKGTSEDYATVKYNAEGNEVWTRKYNNNKINKDDRARAIAVNAAGDVFVTGESWDTNYDFATIKYDTDGNELWVRRFNGTNNKDDFPVAILLDGLDNLYVIGRSTGDSPNWDDYVVVKYDINGNELWSRRYNNTGGDAPVAAAIDSLGNIIITGYTDKGNWDKNYLTLKYDTNGNLIWTKEYGVSYKDDDRAAAVCVDSSDNIYVTGYVTVGTRNTDYCTIKYDSNGNEQWVSTYNRPGKPWGPGSNYDWAQNLTVDSLGNVYVTGRSVGSPWFQDGADCLTVKYNASGVEQWVRIHNGLGDYKDWGRYVITDSSNNIYVAVCSNGNGSENGDYVIVKYDIDGNELWVTRYAGPGNARDHVYGLIMDSGGNLIITGESLGDGTNFDYATAKYDSSGNELWVRRKNFIRGTSDAAVDMAIDPFNNVYIAGNTTGYTGYNYYLLVKYDNQGNKIWERTYIGDDGSYLSAVAADSLGNVYVTGQSFESNFYIDCTTIKYDEDGNLIWKAIYNGEANKSDVGRDVQIDNEGNVYVMGLTETNTNDDIFTVKYDVNGNQIWAKRYDRPVIAGNDYGNAVAIDNLGNVFVAGYSTPTGSTYADCTIIKYDANGNEMWVRHYNGILNQQDVFNALVIDESGNVYAAGRISNNPAGDFLTIKFDTNGNELWVRTYNGPGNVLDNARGVALDASGNVYVTGRSNGNGTGLDYATIKYDSNGNELWVQRYNGPANGEDAVPMFNPIAVDAQGSVFVTGSSLGNGANKDYLTIKYDTNGNELWVKRYNGPTNGADNAMAIVVDSMGNAIVAGTSDGDFESVTGCVTIKYSEISDITPPVTSYIISGTSGNNEWYISNVTIALSAIDDQSGVKEIRYSVDGEPETAGATINLNTEGIHTVIYYAEDMAGNKEQERSLTIKIDKTAPVVNAGPDVVFIETEQVILNPTATDNLDLSPEIFLNPAGPYPVGSTVVTVTAIDDAGNVGTDTLTVTVITAQSALGNLKAMINDLPGDAFRNNANNRKNALSNKIDALISIVNAANAAANPATQDVLYNEAISKLQNDIQAKMDGCPTIADANDWITSCTAQVQLNTLINRILGTLTNLRNV